VEARAYLNGRAEDPPAALGNAWGDVVAMRMPPRPGHYNIHLRYVGYDQSRSRWSEALPFDM
jgi:hypothetical protein